MAKESGSDQRRAEENSADVAERIADAIGPLKVRARQWF
jgi:hypothetical protein